MKSQDDGKEGRGGQRAVLFRILVSRTICLNQSPILRLAHRTSLLCYSCVCITSLLSLLFCYCCCWCEFVEQMRRPETRKGSHGLTVGSQSSRPQPLLFPAATTQQLLVDPLSSWSHACGMGNDCSCDLESETRRGDEQDQRASERGNKGSRQLIPMFHISCRPERRCQPRSRLMPGSFDQPSLPLLPLPVLGPLSSLVSLHLLAYLIPWTNDRQTHESRIAHSLVLQCEHSAVCLCTRSRKEQQEKEMRVRKLLILQSLVRSLLCCCCWRRMHEY